MASTSVEAAKVYLAGHPYSGCECGSLTAFRPEDVKECLAFYHRRPEGYASEEGGILVKLNDGRFGTATQWADTTGHG